MADQYTGTLISGLIETVARVESKIEATLDSCECCGGTDEHAHDCLLAIESEREQRDWFDSTRGV